MNDKWRYDHPWINQSTGDPINCDEWTYNRTSGRHGVMSGGKTPDHERRASRGWMFLIVLASIAILAGLTWAACLLVAG